MTLDEKEKVSFTKSETIAISRAISVLLAIRLRSPIRISLPMVYRQSDARNLDPRDST
jgi:hypothetical protein